MWKEPYKISFRIKVLLENFFEIEDKDSEAIVNDEKTLADLLDELPFVSNVDYNGHFGSAIYLDMDIDADTEENWNKIQKIIKDYIRTEVV